jgi:hypothetical protein
MRPANIPQLQQQMQKLLARKILGRRATKVKEHRKRAAAIADTLYRRFQVGPYQYQLKHILWYLTTHTQSLKPETRYRHWLTIQHILNALNKKELWAYHLNGPWQNPSDDLRSKALQS